MSFSFNMTLSADLCFRIEVFTAATSEAARSVISSSTGESLRATGELRRCSASKGRWRRELLCQRPARLDLSEVHGHDLLYR